MEDITKKMIKLFMSQNKMGGGKITTISYVIGATLFSKGVSKLIYVDETNEEHLLKRWNNELITNFTIEVPKNILTSSWGLQLKWVNPDYTDDYKSFVQSSVYIDGTDITNHAYIESGTASDPFINFNVLTDVGVIRKNLTITINRLPINIFYLTYNSINTPVSTYVNFNLNSSLGVTESTTCKLTYGVENTTTIKTVTLQAGENIVREQTGTFFSTAPLNMYITPKESSNILNRQNLYSGFVCMNFDDAYLYNSTPDKLLSWNEVKTNFWNNFISKTKVTLTLTTTDGDIVSALTMLSMDGKTLMFFFDPRSNIYNQAVESMTFKDEYLGYNLRYEFPSSTSAWTAQIQLNGQFIGLANIGTLEPVPFRGKYKI